MPWKTSSVMEERLRFVNRLIDDESMSDVCREFGISRKTGCKIYSRYREHGLSALTDRAPQCGFSRSRVTIRLSTCWGNWLA
jgi:transposase